MEKIFVTNKKGLELKLVHHWLTIVEYNGLVNASDGQHSKDN